MKFFKSVTAIALSLTMAMAVAGCSSTTQTTTTDTTDSTQTTTEGTTSDVKTYNIATDTTFAPFEFSDENGDFVGIDIDLMEAIAQDQGFEVNWQVLGFNAAVQAVKAGQADGVIAGMSITEERKAEHDFSDPYYDSAVVMAVAAENEDITSYEDLAGKKVAVKVGTEGYNFAESIKDQYGFEMVAFDDSNSMYQDVLVGNSVACFEDYPVIAYGIKQGLALKLNDKQEAGNSYGFAVAKGENAELLQMFNDGLANIKESGKYQEIVDSYTK
ncbi:MAG TPA: transporter substrate-binding domain-containing protein [Candidatus Coprocola pullicola]|nr:transporter substrate-binding domain-containing protein [Candidatus Coprocola pullicola]